MDKALLVKMVGRWLFLPLLLSHVSAQSFSVVVPETPVSGLFGGSVTLPCALSDNLDARKLEVRWYRPSMYSSPALLYLNGKLDLSVADIKYQGRVSLPGPLEKGNVSLRLDDLRPSDTGMYMCHVSSDRWYEKSNMSLTIQAVGSSPILSMLDAGGGKVNVSCRSHGWLPKPSLTWRDSDGSSLNPPNEHTSIEVSEGFFSVSSWRLFTSSESSWVSCSVALPDSAGMIRESRLTPTGDGTWKGAFFGTLILLLLCIIIGAGVGVYFVALKKGWIGSERKKTEGREEAAAQMKPLLKQTNEQTAVTPLQSVFTDGLPLNSSPVEEDQQKQKNSETVNKSNPATSLTIETLKSSEEQNLQTPESTPQLPAEDAHLNSSPVEEDQQKNSETVNKSNPATSITVETEIMKSFEGLTLQTPGQTDQLPAEDVHLNSSPVEEDQQKNSETVNKSNPATSITVELLKSSEELNLETPGQTPHLPAVQSLKKFKVNLTIDPKETPQFLRVTNREKSVSFYYTEDDPEELQEYKIFSLCKEKFSSGKQYWEVKLNEGNKVKLSWFVGVASDEAERVYRVPLTPENGFWVLGYDKDLGVHIIDKVKPIQSNFSERITTLGVFLDCDNHTLSFYNAETQSHIGTYTSVTFKTSLRPLISPGIKGTLPITIC